MQIRFLGHAGFFVDCGRDKILCDPWFSPYGAYAAAWFPFPANDSIDLERLELATHLYISHWHEDHLDEWFLHTRSDHFKRSVIVVIPKFQYPRLKEVIAQCGYSNIIEIEEEYLTANGTRIYIQRDENPLYSDSSITIGNGHQVFVNSNDCKLTIGQEEEILRRFGHVTVFAAQFSGATFHPTCYEYPTEKKIEMSRVRREAKFQRIVSSMERLRANAYIPSAGPACFLSNDLFHLNRNPGTVFSSNSDFYSWLKNNNERSWSFTEMLPGETIDANALSEKRASFNFETEAYLKQYSEHRQTSISERIAQFDHPMDDVLGEAKKHFRSKLDDVPALARKANVLLEFRVGANSFFVDTLRGIITNAQPERKKTAALPNRAFRFLDAGYFRWKDSMGRSNFIISIQDKPDARCL